MLHAFDVCIHGDGIVGRTLALLLARDKLRVALVTGQVAPATPDVRAYALNPASQRLLASLRVWPQPDQATPVLRMQVWGDEGGHLSFDAGEQGCAALNWVVDVPTLEKNLAEAMRYQAHIVPVQAAPSAALHVVCEGRAAMNNPQWAQQLRFAVSPYTQHALACRVHCAQAHGQVARQWFVGSAQNASVLALLPLDGPLGQTVAVVWSLPPVQAEQLIQQTPQAFAQALQSACDQALGEMSLCSERSQWPLQSMQATPWVGPGWAVAGDAAHNLHPLSGQGLNLGLADAQQLASTLAAREYWRGLGDWRLLRRYERARKADMAAITWATDGLQRLFTRADSGSQKLRNWGFNQFDRSNLIKTWAVRLALGEPVLAAPLTD